MALLWNKLPSIVVRQPIYSLNTYRYVRGGTTITIKATQPRTKESINQELIRYRKVKQSNRGASRTLHAINERYGKLDPELDHDYVDNMSTVVNDVDAELNEQMKAANKDLTAKSLFNIKRKYFKEPKLPNMVPYLEKQDMKILHENDPENWNVDKIAESFPVTPQIAKKILRSSFRAYTVEQVKRHDEAVKRNWKLLKEGKLDIPDELRDHLHKFVDRISFETKDNVIKKYLPSKPNFEIHIKKKEFSSIIDKYEMHKNGSKPNQNKVHIDEDNKIVLEKPEASMSMIDEDTKSNVYHKHVTLDLLRDKIRKQSHKASELSQLILEMENKYQPQSKNEVQTLQENFDHVVDDEVMNKDYENMLTKINDKYPLRIDIPEDKWKPNQLYQVKDCFYNDSGAFLFRVPGLFK